MKSSDTPNTTQLLATAIARQYTIDELVHALRLIEHATAPTHDDGAHHEAAHQIATDALHGCSTTHPALKCPRCNGNSYVITVEGGMPGGAECPLCVGDGAPRNDAERAFVAALTTQPAPSTIWRYVVNGVHVGYADAAPPDDAYDAGTLTRYTTQPAMELTDEQAEHLIENSDGRWVDCEFRIDGPDLMKLLRAACRASASSAAVGEQWEGAEEWMPLAWALCAEENGEEACNELIWEGGPIPEPWGDRWMQYEGEAKRLINLVRKHVPPSAQQEGD